MCSNGVQRILVDKNALEKNKVVKVVAAHEQGIVEVKTKQQFLEFLEALLASIEYGAIKDILSCHSSAYLWLQQYVMYCDVNGEIKAPRLFQVCVSSEPTPIHDN